MEPQPSLYLGGNGIVNLIPEDFKVENGKVYLREGRLNKLVSNSGFIQFYAPWCGHCRNYVSTYKTFGDLVYDKKGDLLLLGAFNCTQPGCNSLLNTLNINSFPTMKYVEILGGSGTKKMIGGSPYRQVKLSEYTGSRDIASMLKYACDNGKVCINRKK
jgi:hypothetical protein